MAVFVSIEINGSSMIRMLFRMPNSNCQSGDWLSCNELRLNCTTQKDNCMETLTITKEELLDTVSSAVNAAMQAYQATRKKEFLVPRLVAISKLGKSSATLWRWERESYLVPVRKGKSVMYWSSDLERLGVVFD